MIGEDKNEEIDQLFVISRYDSKAMVCAYDEVASIGYNLLLMVGAILIPLTATVFSYSKLF